MTRFTYMMVAYGASMATIITGVVSPSPRLIWNASASVPIGLYTVRRVRDAKRGELVAVKPPETLAAYLAQRQYLPRGVPLLKHVAAVGGQRVCRIRERITVDGRHLADARRYDRGGRALPVWRGCHVLAHGEIFLLNAQVPDSVDGRYFGTLPTATLLGRLSPLWLRSAPDRRGDGGAIRSGSTKPGDTSGHK